MSSPPFRDPLLFAVLQVNHITLGMEGPQGGSCHPQSQGKVSCEPRETQSATLLQQSAEDSQQAQGR